jgi:hypothetical protein
MKHEHKHVWDLRFQLSGDVLSTPVDLHSLEELPMVVAVCLTGGGGSAGGTKFLSLLCPGGLVTGLVAGISTHEALQIIL